MLTTIVTLTALAQCGPGGCPLPQRQAFGLYAPRHRAVYYYRAPVATYAVPAPQLYRLADSAGQAWQHADPNYLRAWVAGRNAALAKAKVVCPLTGSPCRCAAGECGKAGCPCQAVAPGPPRPDVGR